MLDMLLFLGVTINSKTASDFDLFAPFSFFVISFFVLFPPHPQLYFITLSNKTVVTWSGSYKNSGLNVPITSGDLLRPEILRPASADEKAPLGAGSSWYSSSASDICISDNPTVFFFFPSSKSHMLSISLLV